MSDAGWLGREDWIQAAACAFSREIQVKREWRTERAETSNPDAYAGLPCFPRRRAPAERLWQALQMGNLVPAPAL